MGYQNIHMTSQRTGDNETKAYSDNPYLPTYYTNWGLPKLERLQKAMCNTRKSDKSQTPKVREMTLNIQYGNGVLVVVRGRESRLHGEGERLLRSKIKI